MFAKIKRFLSVFLALLMLCCVPVRAGAEGPDDWPRYKRGDINEDGAVTTEDARLVLRTVIGLSYFSDFHKMLCDLDGNGKLTTADARSVLRTAIALENEKFLEFGNYALNGTFYSSWNEIPNHSYYIWVYYDWQVGKPAYEISYLRRNSESRYSPDTDPYYYMCDDEDIEGCKARVGLYYNDIGIHCDYDDIVEGDTYFYYAIYNGRAYSYMEHKPYSPGNEPEPEDYSHCKYCGRPIIMYDGEHFGCWYGGCDRFMADITCPECGEFVKANTCHTCKH